MHFKISCIAVLIFSFFNGKAQNFYRSYGNVDDEAAKAVTETSDSLFFIFGSSSSFVNGTSNFYLLHIDSLGNFIWSKTYGGDGIEQGHDIARKPNGNYLLTGFSNSYGNGGYDILTLEIDSTGTEVWQKTYGGSDWDFAYGNLSLPTGEAIITGSTYSFGNGNQDGFLLMIDDNGDSLWMKTYGNANENVLRKTIVTSTGEMISVGYTITSSGDKDFYVVKSQPNGDTVWTRNYGTAFNEEGFAVMENRFGNYIFTGYTDSINGNGKDCYYFETDTSGSVNWVSLLGISGDESMNAIVIRPNSNKFYATTESSSYGSGEFDFMITTFFTGGGWYDTGNTYGTLYTEKPYDLIYTSHKRLLAVGSTDSPFGNTNIMAVLTDTLYPTQATMNSYTDVTAIAEFNGSDAIKVYPNPANDFIGIHSGFQIQQVTVIDLEGRVVTGYTSEFHQLDISSLPPAMYILQITSTEGLTVTGKLTITRR